VATGLGAVFGFQSWKLSEFGFAAAISWHGSLWIFLGQAMLGFSAGATAGFMPWWIRGWLLGLFFGIPAAWDTHTMELQGAPLGIGVVVSGVVTGLLIAFLTDTIFPPQEKRSAVRQASGEPASAPAEECKLDAIRLRLAAEKACLEDLESERVRLRDSRVGRATEERVIWGELLDLELQDIDEQVSRICSTAGSAAGAQREHWWTAKHKKRSP
jgi:hypothetical protein